MHILGVSAGFSRWLEIGPFIIFNVTKNGGKFIHVCYIINSHLMVKVDYCKALPHVATIYYWFIDWGLMTFIYLTPLDLKKSRDRNDTKISLTRQDPATSKL